ncbi:phosphoenolpyruvate carboxylase [Candidatus Falkowbacteria bacterium CG10_big_fil_rev_8_21_14_0_10_43_11]|uniref:Phosphoenolpyruvate carboxylase n=1 Tax=Candidatus Falkowbacteria bacterium CG10_big_fil_rev_8_21_14_0_10_43_11 TaxID=1974568 RepID=A0A2M6WLH4_9BACT|nr:MAG: phosphoenolpyruvate carboxylase [Candidatus Falkowbacteria bacterium CG10_big_fil_rev_8_21_14_0_10_43_11]
MTRKIPATMATQHPDNACAPYWERDGDGFISTYEEVAECHSAFHDLDCEEFMWDWEGKYVDEGVVDKLFHTYYQYFKKNQLGKDKFLTFRIPNIWHEKGYGLARALMGILTAESFAGDMHLHTPPLFEVILPMTDKAANIIYIQKTFTKLAKFKCKLFEQKCAFNYLNVLPLLEGVDDLISCRHILDEYLALHKKEYKKKPEYLRLHIARSDPALNSGLVPAVVAGKVALSEYYRFGKENNIKIFPAIGVGTLPFRGGLSPEKIGDFLREYSGMRTVYVQSAFRYDFPLAKVRAAIKKLNCDLPKTQAKIYGAPETKEAKDICEIFTPPYRATAERIADTINELAGQVPARRERKLHVGLFGYSRGVGKKKLPRAIPFTAVLYSLGVPPEFIGTGRGLEEALNKKINLEKYYLNFKKDLLWAGRYLNKENLAKLANVNLAWKDIQRDVETLEGYFKIELGPKSNTDFIHRNLTSNAFYLWRAGKPVSKEMIESGKIRRSLG